VLADVSSLDLFAASRGDSGHPLSREFPLL
jgi:hypothetical protein